MPLRAVIYARLSPTPKGDAFKGGNLQQQVAMCRAKCDENDWNVVAVIEDRDASAVSRKARPGWQKLLKLVEDRKVEVIIGRHYDRLYRRPDDLEKLITLTEDTGVRIVAAESDSLGIDLTSATGLVQARILVAFAAGETDIKRERQLAGQRRRVDAGLPWWGNRPFGYEKDLSIRESEAEHIRNAYRAVLEGVSIGQLVREWNDRGLLTVKGGPWCTTTVRRLLAHPRNAALVVYDGLEWEVEAAWPPIIDIETYRAVAYLVNRRVRASGLGPLARRGILSGIATCAAREPDGTLCGGRVVLGANVPRNDGTQLRKYVCDVCHRASFPADLLEDYVMAGLFHLTRSNRAVGSGIEGESGQRAEVDARRETVNGLITRKEQLRDLYVSGELSGEDYVSGNQAINQRLGEARTLLAIAQLRRTDKETPASRSVTFADLVDMYCNPAKHGQLRRVIREHLTYLAVTPGTHLRRWRSLSEIFARWNDADAIPSDLMPRDSSAWADAEIRMHAARVVWAEQRAQRKADLLRQHEDERTSALISSASAPSPRAPPLSLGCRSSGEAFSIGFGPQF